MYWNHRIIKHTNKDGYSYFGIHEVFYNSKDEIYGYSNEPIDISESTLDELRETLQMMMSCLNKEILEADKIKFGDRDG
jgi:hypothetical protein